MDYAGDASKRDEFFNMLEKVIERQGPNYIDAVKGLAPSEAKVGTLWLQGIIDDIKERISSIL